MSDYIVRMKNICKSFDGVVALNNANLNLQQGSITALLGENGAGKSTLIHILSGVLQPNSGEIIFINTKIPVMSPKVSRELGIRFIYQHQHYVPHFTVAQTLWLGEEPKKRFNIVDYRKMVHDSRELLTRTIGLDIDPNAYIMDLSVSQRQMIEIAKVFRDPNINIVVFDEPTAPLTEKEVCLLFETIRILNKKGVSILYISHRLEEIFKLCGNAVILRDGCNVGEPDISATTTGEIVRLMVGREMKQNSGLSGSVERSRPALCVENLSSPPFVSGVSFDLYKGEVLGIFGLVGAGKTEMARLIFGADRVEHGRILVNGDCVRFRAPRDAVKKRLAFLPEDRRLQGLVLEMSVQENVTLASLADFTKGLFLKLKSEQKAAGDSIKSLGIKTTGTDQIVRLLSGGNQQKVILARWLLSKASIFIFDQPTVGIDVGAKAEIYKLIDTLAQNGASVILISSEMQEVLNATHRILVMYSGTIVREFFPGETNQHDLLAAAMGTAE